MSSDTDDQRERAERARSADPPVQVGQVWTCPDNSGELGFRRLRILAPHPDGGWIVEDAPSRWRPGSRYMTRTPEFNLRYVFVLEPASTGEGVMP